MSVTITRDQAVELGEEAVAHACDQYLNIQDENPEVIAFRQVLANAPAVARGTSVPVGRDGVCCPMKQTIFSFEDSLMARYLASAWDFVTRAHDLDVSDDNSFSNKLILITE